MPGPELKSLMPNTLTVGNRTLPLDNNGYLENLGDWTPEVAQELAADEGLLLTAEHWEIITLLRDFHARSGLVPNMRALVSLVRRECGKDKGSSLYLLRLFPDSPVRRACKIAGLPRPTNCL